MPAAPPSPPDAPAIDTRGLTKQYPGGVVALRDLDLTVPRGEVFGLLGPNGAGKSTTLRILLDMIRPSAGSARVLGYDTQREGVAARKHLGYLPSSPRFYPRLTGAELFAFIAEARALTPRSSYLEYARVLARRLELDTTRHIRTLSRGNQQKVGLIVAFVARPELLILDEPTTGLDPLMQEVTHELVTEVARDGRTVFFSSHFLPEVEQVCHRVAALRDGALAGVYDLAEQRRLAPRQISVAFDMPPAPSQFLGVSGVRVIETSGSRIRFEVRDGIDSLIKQLAHLTVLDIEAREPTLEEFFFSLYEDPAEPPGEDGGSKR